MDQKIGATEAHLELQKELVRIFNGGLTNAVSGYGAGLDREIGHEVLKVRFRSQEIKDNAYQKLPLIVGGWPVKSYA